MPIKQLITMNNNKSKINEPAYITIPKGTFLHRGVKNSTTLNKSHAFFTFDYQNVSNLSTFSAKKIALGYGNLTLWKTTKPLKLLRLDRQKTFNFLNSVLTNETKIIFHQAYKMRKGAYERMSSYSKNKAVSDEICSSLNYDGYIAFPSATLGLMQEIMLCSPKNKIEKQNINGLVNVSPIKKLILNEDRSPLKRKTINFPINSYSSPLKKERVYNKKPNLVVRKLF